MTTSKTKNPRLLDVHVYSTTTELKHVTVEAVQSENSEGEFSILPDHAQFITLIHNTDINLVSNGEVVDAFQIKQAVIHVKNNVVSIYVGLNEKESASVESSKEKKANAKK